MPRRLALVLACLLASSVIHAEVRVIDGGTIEIDGQGYRINGIDTPEIGQRCNGTQGSWRCGKDAADAMLALVADREVTCEEHSRDRYGRIIATCYADGVDLGEELVSQGLAWAFRRYSTVYVDQEEAAKHSSIGIWSAENIPAW